MSGEPIPLGLAPGDDGRGERRDAHENRLRILQAAEALFAARGVAAVTMAEIAAAAGVGKGTLYRRYTGKSDLCLELLNEQMRRFQEAMLALLRREAAAATPYLAQLKQFLAEVAAFTERHAPLLYEIERDEGLPEGAVRQAPYTWYHMTVVGLLERAERAGELAPGIDAAFLAVALLAPLNHAIFRLQQRRHNFTAARIVAGLHQIIDVLAGRG